LITEEIALQPADMPKDVKYISSLDESEKFPPLGSVFFSF